MKNYRLIWAIVCITAALVLTGQTALGVAPANDSASNALPIGNVTNQAFSTTDATYSASDTSDTYIYSPDIWYCYTATHTGTTTVSLCGSGYDTKLVIYNGCQAPATTARVVTGATGDGGSGKDDDGCNDGTTRSRISFPSICGNQYLIQIGGYNYGTIWQNAAKGNGVISISATGTPCSSGPANDNCSNAELVGNVVNKTFSTAGATHDGPNFACDQGNGPNIWYRYVATCSGTAVISLCGSSFDTILAVYTGSCGNLSLVNGGCNDDWCGNQSRVSIAVTAGNSYYIEISGRGTGFGIMNITCNGQTQQASDLGDAPDSSNHKGSSMRTYDDITPITLADFPTVFDGPNPKGPIHLNPKARAWLGNAVTFEDEADQGYDEDGTNNILPQQLNNNANRDGADDGVVMISDALLGSTLGMNHCKLASFNYKVNVIDPNVDLWVNVWFDWNRDGDWNDSGLTVPQLNCTTCNSAGVVNEWAVQNQLLFGLKKGLNTVTAPGFLAWYPPANKDQKVWMRITLSEQPFKGGTGAGGSGPADGYMYGETEDYYFTPKANCTICEDLNRDGVVDSYDLFTYLMDWLDNCID